jgi:hypothetical protein
MVSARRHLIDALLGLGTVLRAAAALLLGEDAGNADHHP